MTQLSPDRRWWWDGARWQPVNRPRILFGNLVAVVAFVGVLCFLGFTALAILIFLRETG